MKVVGLVAGCRDCPNKSYYSGGRSRCSKAGALLPHDLGHSLLPDWCPLPDYPAAAMARLSDENAMLRRQMAELEAGSRVGKKRT